MINRERITEMLIGQWKLAVDDFEREFGIVIDCLLVLSICERGATRNPGSAAVALTEPTPPDARNTLLAALIAGVRAVGTEGAGGEPDGSSGSVCGPTGRKGGRPC